MSPGGFTSAATAFSVEEMGASAVDDAVVDVVAIVSALRLVSLFVVQPMTAAKNGMSNSLVNIVAGSPSPVSAVEAEYVVGVGARRDATTAWGSAQTRSFVT